MEGFIEAVTLARSAYDELQNEIAHLLIEKQTAANKESEYKAYLWNMVDKNNLYYLRTEGKEWIYPADAAELVGYVVDEDAKAAALEEYSRRKAEKEGDDNE